MHALSTRTATRFARILLPCLMIGTPSPLSAADSLAEAQAPAGRPLYVGNREPLTPSKFMKLPIGTIKPQGWLRRQLEMQGMGMIGHLKEISPWLRVETSAWGNKEGLGERGWEELPYWLKGFGDLGYVLEDARIIAEAKPWIEAALASQREDGWFGPRALLTSLDGKADLWPNMVMLNVLQSWHEYSGDPRVITLMTKYFQWQNQLPAEAFGVGYWPKLRAGDNIESVFWLYNRTGTPWLLDLAKKIHQHMGRWDTGVINWHNVNIAQGFRAATIFAALSHDPKHWRSAENNWQQVMDLYGQFPGGGFAGDENCRAGYDDPRQGFETCGIVEFMHSYQLLTRFTAEPIWADRCEDIAFNTLPAALTPDHRALHYLTCANQVQLDRHNKAPGIQNGGTMFSYSPFEVYRCCQHNVSHGWPYFAEELWLATSDRGLCAALHAPSEVTAKVGRGIPVTIVTSTEYPFEDEIRMLIKTPEVVRFPLYIRIPAWCEEAIILVNGQRATVPVVPGSFAPLNRHWRNGETVTVRLPMNVKVRRWPKNHDAASVHYGPLTFSLRIGEEWTPYGGNELWPEFEVHPTTPWNYGLQFNPTNPAPSFLVSRRPGALWPNPFTPETSPLAITAKARQIPVWKTDELGLVGKLQPSPVKSEEPLTEVTLIPMGAARLRITSFPVISQEPDAHIWVDNPRPPVSASHCNPGDTVEALNDGREPKNSADESVPRFTWWDHKGTAEWVEWGFPKVRPVSSVAVFWYDDTGRGQCRVPQSWTLQYRVGERWFPVEDASEYGLKPDVYNRVTFKPVRCEGLRIDVQLQPECSGGILEWQISG